jgi:hypothetical protein
LDRSYFWQTVWADDKFPKNQQEHEQYLKTNVFGKIVPPFKNIYEVYGITPFVLNDVRQKQYRQVTNFYHSAKAHTAKVDLLSTAKQHLKKIDRNISKRLYKMNNAVSQNEANPFHHYLIDEQSHYLSAMKRVREDIQQYLSAEEIFSKEEEGWCLSVISNRTPASWGVSTIVHLDSWLETFLEGYIYAFDLNCDNIDKKNSGSDITRVYHLDLTHHFASFCQCIMGLNGCSFETHCMFWEPLKVDLISNGICIKVDRWYIWNAEFKNILTPLAEGTIKEHYFLSLPRGVLTVMDR